jgi:membrane protease YdiL (CAAX protease family)
MGQAIAEIDEELSAQPHLMVLANEKTAPSARLAAAQWLCRHNLALPTAITALIELVFAPKGHDKQEQQMAFEALAQLGALDDSLAVEALQGLGDWGPTEKVRLKAKELLSSLSPLSSSFSSSPLLLLPPSETPLAKLEEPDESRPMMVLAARTQGTELAVDGMSQPLSTPAAAFASRTLAGIGIFWRLLRHDNQQPWRFPLLVLALTTMAELVTTFIEPRGGMLLHGVTILLLLYNFSEIAASTVRRLQTVLLLIPMIRILSLALPLSAWPQISWYLAASVPLFATMMLIIQQESWHREELGLTLHRFPLQLAIGIVGIELGWVEYQILQPTPLATELTWQALWLPALILLVSTGLLEELLFRGLLQSAAISLIGRGPALLFVATLFAVLHIGYASVLDVLFVFVIGLVFGLFVDRTRSILGVTLAHGITNISLFLLWPLWLG